MKRESIAIASIYVPVKRRATLDQKRVDEIATSMLDKGQQAPILVRADGARFVLVEGLHRLEAAKALGEKTILCFLVDVTLGVEAPSPLLRTPNNRRNKWPRARSKCLVKTILTKKRRKYSPNASGLRAGGICSR